MERFEPGRFNAIDSFAPVSQLGGIIFSWFAVFLVFRLMFTRLNRSAGKLRGTTKACLKHQAA